MRPCSKHHMMYTSRWGGNRFLTQTTHPGGGWYDCPDFGRRRCGVVFDEAAQIASGAFLGVMINWGWLVWAASDLRSNQVSSNTEPDNLLLTSLFPTFPPWFSHSCMPFHLLFSFLLFPLSTLLLTLPFPFLFSFFVSYPQAPLSLFS